MRCDTCGQDRVVTLVHTLKIGKRRFAWRECIGCHRAAEAR
jgi:hypothetical protein